MMQVCRMENRERVVCILKAENSDETMKMIRQDLRLPEPLGGAG